MTEPQLDTSIGALLARPPEGLQPREISELQAGLLAGAAALAEVAFYEAAAKVALTDPVEAYRMLRAHKADDVDFVRAFPLIRAQLLDGFSKRPDAVTDTVDFAARAAAGGTEDRAREAAFRRAPGRYLPGATRSPVAAFPDTGFGVVRYEGQDWLWTYAAAGYAASDLAELEAALAESQDLPTGGWFSGILVGPPGIERECRFRHGIRFVAVDLDTTPGRAA